MSLFNKKNKETKVPACACNADCPTSEVTEIKLEKECYGNQTRKRVLRKSSRGN